MTVISMMRKCSLTNLRCMASPFNNTPSVFNSYHSAAEVHQWETSRVCRRDMHEWLHARLGTEAFSPKYLTFWPRCSCRQAVQMSELISFDPPVLGIVREIEFLFEMSRVTAR